MAKPSVQWGVRLVGMVILSFSLHGLGWGWPASVPASLVIVFLAFRLGNRIGFYLDVRHGLKRREWIALMGMAHHARRGIKTDFDGFAVRRAQNTDEATLTGYGAILVNSLIARTVGPKPTEDQIRDLVAELTNRWTYLMKRDPVVLDRLVRTSCRYPIDGLPAASWDSLRGLAAIAGLLGSAPMRRSLRRVVAIRYIAAARQRVITDRKTQPGSPGSAATAS